jgi:hypothetical protein
MRFVIFAFLVSLTGTALADCGDKGGPGYRAANGRCVGWSDTGKTRGGNFHVPVC